MARYLSIEQRRRAAQATYEAVEIPNSCERGDCWTEGEFVPVARSVSPTFGVCPIGVAIGWYGSPEPWQAESALSSGTSRRANQRRLAAIQRYMHDVDSGKIGPADVAASLGVES